jgi:hypothetical protein
MMGNFRELQAIFQATAEIRNLFQNQVSSGACKLADESFY